MYKVVWDHMKLRMMLKIKSWFRVLEYYQDFENNLSKHAEKFKQAKKLAYLEQNTYTYINSLPTL